MGRLIKQKRLKLKKPCNFLPNDAIQQKVTKLPLYLSFLAQYILLIIFS